MDILRKPSDTPNISPKMDYRVLDMACGGQRGVNSKVGDALGYSVDGNIFTIKSGELVVDGVQAEITGNGESVTVDNVAQTRYYAVYCEINLQDSTTPTATIKSIYNTLSVYPTVSDGDNLVTSPYGTANVLLYTFIAVSGVISSVVKKVDSLTQYDERLNGLEGRLDELGFKTGDTGVSGVTLTKNGKYAILQISNVTLSGSPRAVTFNLPTGWYPKRAFGTYIGTEMSIGGGYTTNYLSTVSITTGGVVTITCYITSTILSAGAFGQIGYEIA